MRPSCDEPNARTILWRESPEVLISDVSTWLVGVDVVRWDRSPALGRWPGSAQSRQQIATVVRAIRRATNLGLEAESLKARRADPRLPSRGRDVLDKRAALRHAEASAVWLTLDATLDAGLELRREGFVTDMSGGALYAVLRARVRPSGRLMVCTRCDRVFEPTRKRSLRSPECPRCHSGVRVPARECAPGEYRSPVFEAAGAFAGWERRETRVCSCGRHFTASIGPRGGRPRTRCHGCDGRATERQYAFMSDNGAPLTTVSFVRTDGTAVRLDAVDGVITTVDAEDALGILRWMPGLRRF